ncbi:MAG: hypothetical protein BRD55_07810 [Bacteroidetes bacterium SW_9_63_38]|nr:MAG: hypothetical protein BRD55_07810 [Bacteroidetes bacterium SW_9_63_38]
MIELALAVACSVAIGMIFKHTGPRNIDRTVMLTVNYAAAVGVAVLLIGLGGRDVNAGLELSGDLLLLGGGVGALLIAGFYLLSYATDVAGMSLAVGVTRVSVVVPFLASWGVWNEVPSVAQGGGMVLAAVSFFLIAQKHRPPDSESGGLVVGADGRSGIDWYAFGVLALTFCSGGAVDLSMKTFEEVYGAEHSRVLFLLLAFGGAFLVGVVVIAVRGLRGHRWGSGRAVGWGLLLGIVNYGSLEFILRAIAELPGPFVFPANNIAIMVASALIGVYVWSERLSWINRVGMALAVAALVLLRL